MHERGFVALSADRKTNIYAYVESDPLRDVDSLGLYTVKSGVPAPSPDIDRLVTCIETCSNLSLTITSTTDYHGATTLHGRGQAVDLRYPSDADIVLCCAARCGAGYGLDEKKHPSRRTTAPHIHLQLPSGRGGRRGDLPSSTAKCTPPTCAP